MPTSSPSNVTTKENPPNSSATPTAKSSPKVSAATAKEKEKDKKPTAAAAAKGSMGARLSTTAGSAGKAPSTASASSTHTASTVPADGAEAKAKTKSGGGVAGFLRRKPSSKETAAGPSAGNAAAKKDAKKGVGSSLRTSLFKRSTKSKNGGEPPAAAASAAPAATPGTSTAANSSGVKASPATAAAAKPPSAASTSSQKGRTTPDKGRITPDKGRASPEKRRASTDKSPAERRGVSPPKIQRPSSRTEASPGDSAKKSPSPRPGGVTAASRSNQGLTPERKEALKKQWFTDGKPLPESRGRATGKTGAGSRTEPRSRPGAGETVGPPSSASRVSGSAFSAAAAKFGGVSKAPPKPQPGSPKKSDKSPTSPKKTTVTPGSPKKAGGASGGPKKSVGALGSPKKSDRSPVSPKKADALVKPVTVEGFDDLMGAMTGFKTEEDSKSKDANAKENENSRVDAKSSAKDEVVSSSVNTDVGAKPEASAPAPDGGLDDLMGAMDGFNPGGSKTDKGKSEKTNNGMGSPEPQNTVAKEDEHKAKTEVVSAKDDLKTVDEKGGAKDDTSVPTSDKKESSKDVSKKDEKSEKGDKNGTVSKVDVKDVSKEDAVTPKDTGNANDDKTKDPSSAAAESKAEKSSTWRPGDSDSGELGLGGISQKDREERAHRPSAPKDDGVDLDFLMGQIDTTPKPLAAEPKSSKKDDSPKSERKKSADKDDGLGDLMDLAKGFDMSAMSRSEPVVAEAQTAPEMASSDMDKFLDMMDTTPAKAAAPPSGPPVKEKDAVKKDTWRLGDGDDEAMVALMNKPRDMDAPRQAPDWDIDDLLVGKVTKKPEAKEEKPAPEKKASSGQADIGGLSGFDDFIGGSLSGDAGKANDKQSSEDIKPKASSDGGNKKTVEAGDKAFSGFDDFLSDSLSGKDSASGGDSNKRTDKTADKEPADKKPAGGDFSGFDDFLSGSLAAEGDSKKPADKTADKKPADKKAAGGEFSAFDDFLSSAPSDKESTGGLPHEDSVAAPKKVSAVDSAPPATVEEEVIAAASSSQTTAAPTKPKRALDKHTSKEGDTRGSVPDHGHGVRDLLYDDSDKTGTKPAAPREDPKSREPAMLDDLIRPAKASTTSSAPPAASKEDVVVAQAASTTEAGKPSGTKATDEHREKPGNTRGSVPDHGHGVRDVLYDDSDKTGQKKAGAKDDAKRREPAPLDDLIQPKKVAASHAAPGKGETHSSDDDEEEESISAETAHQSQASGQAAGKKKRRSRKKKHAKEGDTRGSVPDHGHGVRDVLYDDSDKTGRKKTPSESKEDAKHREPADLADLIQPKKTAASHAAPAARSSSPESKKTDEVVTAQTAHQAHAAAPASGKKSNKKKQSKEGDTRGSVPDHGHGVRDVLYDDKDKTGRRKSESKEEAKPREPAPLDDLIQPKKAAASHAAPGKTPSRSPSPDGEEEDEISAETAHQAQASGQASGKKKRKRKKKQAKEGDTRGSVPDHGHGVRDVLYDDSDKTGQKKAGAKDDAKRREPEPLEDLIRPKQTSHTASAPPSHAGGAAATGAEQPLVAEKNSAVQSAPAAAAPPSPTRQEPARQSLSLAGMTEPDQEDSDDGEELRRLIASTEALQEQLHSGCHGDSKQAHAVQEQTSQQLERLERSLEQRERRLETAGRGQEVRAAKEGLQKVKQQLDKSRAGGAAAH